MSEAQHFAIMAPRYPDGGAIGGAETLLKNLAEHLVRMGKTVHFLTTCAKDHHSWENTVEPGIETINGVEIHYFEVDGNRDLETFLRVQDRISIGEKISREDELGWINNSVHSTPLYEHLKSNEDFYDAILTGPYLFGITWKGAQILPHKTFLVPCLHDEVFAYLSIMNDLFDAVKGILFNAEPELHLAVKLYGIDPGKARVVGMGMDDFDSDKESFSKRHKLSCPYIIYSGRREGLKGTPLLVSYLNTFIQRTGKELKAVFTGSGDINPPPELAPHVIDLGFVSEKDKQEAMAGGAVFIHPSVNESFGIVLLEAFLGRTPGLVHGKGDVLTDQCRKSNAGFWFRNYPEFEALLLRLLDDHELRKQMGENGRNYVLNEYSWEAIGGKLMRAVAEIS